MNPLCARFEAEGGSKFTESMLVLTPFFRCIRPTVAALTVSAAEVVMPHPTALGSTDPRLNVSGDAAICALALFTGGLAIDASNPPGLQWSLVGFKVEHAGPVEHEVHALADTSAIDWTAAGRYEVPVHLLAVRRDRVASATLSIEVASA